YGSMANPMNRDAFQHLVENILPRLRARVPDVRLTVVGAFPGADVREIAARDGGITVTGYVEDVRVPLATAGVVVCPLRYAYGIRGRIYELMSMSVPRVVTPVAIEGMELEPGDGLLVEETPDAFAAAVTRVLAEPDLQSRLGTRGRQIAVGRMSIGATYDRLADFLEQRLAPDV